MKTLPMVSIYLRRMKTLLNNQASKVKEDSSDETKGSKEDTESFKRVKVSRKDDDSSDATKASKDEEDSSESTEESEEEVTSDMDKDPSEVFGESLEDSANVTEDGGQGGLLGIRWYWKRR